MEGTSSVFLRWIRPRNILPHYSFARFFEFPFSPGIWPFHSRENGNEKIPGISGARETGAREWKPYRQQGHNYRCHHVLKIPIMWCANVEYLTLVIPIACVLLLYLIIKIANNVFHNLCIKCKFCHCLHQLLPLVCSLDNPRGHHSHPYDVTYQNILSAFTRKCLVYLVNVVLLYHHYLYHNLLL